MKPNKAEGLKYEEYRALMQSHGLPVKDIESWLTTYRNVQERLNKKPTTLASGVVKNPSSQERRAELQETVEQVTSTVYGPPEDGRTRCLICRKEQKDSGKGRTCEKCGMSPLPSRKYRADCVFHTDYPFRKTRSKS